MVIPILLFKPIYIKNPMKNTIHPTIAAVNALLNNLLIK